MQSNLEISSITCETLINLLENKSVSEIDPDKLIIIIKSIQESIDEAVKIYEKE